MGSFSVETGSETINASFLAFSVGFARIEKLWSQGDTGL
jgi:hypothetical protein